MLYPPQTINPTVHPESWSSCKPQVQASPSGKFASETYGVSHQNQQEAYGFGMFLCSTYPLVNKHSY